MSELIDPSSFGIKWPIPIDMVENFVYLNEITARPPVYAPIPPVVNPVLRSALAKKGILQFYKHQSQSWDYIQKRQNQVIVTGTASGKSLCYHVPVLDTALVDPLSRALYIFPTKALAQDQLSSIREILASMEGNHNPIIPAIYDGDTPASQRKTIRETSTILLTNPDMLHTGILPRHTHWANFFTNLQFVVLDEIHIYRGVFGSHVANVIRRLLRICHHYGSNPLFILTSATIANAREHAEALIDGPVQLVDQDGAGKGRRSFGIYNPPISNPELGIRKSALFESLQLIQPMVDNNFQTIIFGRARKTIELVLHYLQRFHPDIAQDVRAYRSGYLAKDRREVEAGLRSGRYKAVVSTSALELGLDIGTMDVSISIGYPGSIASTLQQMGRAGRQSRESLSILLATSTPIDQYLANHPEYFLGLSPEKAYINPNHLLILMQHLRCAAYELPFQEPFQYGNLPTQYIQEFLDLFQNEGLLHQENSSFYWLSSEYPASGFSLRSASGEQVLLKTDEQIIGTVDLISAYWMVHPDAIYFHEGKTFRVANLDLEHHTATLQEVDEDYFTEPKHKIEIQVKSVLAEKKVKECSSKFGELQVSSQVTGYKRVKYFTNELLDSFPLEMPIIDLQTTGFWVTIPDEVVNDLRNSGNWLNDPNDYGPSWTQIRLAVRQRDQFRCRNCGVQEGKQSHHVHHKIPFRGFLDLNEANQMDNLITLCPTCHQIAEGNVRLQSGLAGLTYSVRNLAPLFLMCDMGDIEAVSEQATDSHTGMPTMTMYDTTNGGIGLSRTAYDRLPEILLAARELILSCSCQEGCPSCIGPAGENGYAGKRETLALLEKLI